MDQKQTAKTKCKLFWDKNKKRILIIGGVTIVIIGAIGGIKVITSRKAKPYSGEWLESLTDEEWANEREKVRQAFVASGDDFHTACWLENLLARFDAVKRARDWADVTDYEYPKYSSNGPYLLSDD